jgi:mono/diheme cytochrome c family protein
MRRLFVLHLITALVLSFPLFGAGSEFSGAWFKKVPAREHERTNPYRGQSDAIAAGRRIYVEHCLHCHGEDAQGTKKHPPLRSDRVQNQATDGDLHWLLVNGSMKKGMPSWAKLPDQQLWQVITYVKSLGN